MRILICDSDPGSSAALARLLHQVEGCQVDTCASGTDAIDRLEHERYDALMLDTDLPVLDGFEAVALIRQDERLRTLPVVMVTRDRSREAVMRGLELSVADYLLKPVRLARLHDALHHVVERQLRNGRTAAPADDTADSRPHTLIVDGDSEFRDTLGTILEPHCRISLVPTGAKALNEAWSALPSTALIGRDIGPIGPQALGRYLKRLGTEGIIKVATPEEIATESASGLYTGVVGRSTNAAVVLRDLRRFIPLPNLHLKGTLQQLLAAVPSLRDVIVRTTADVFTARLSADADVRDAGPSDILGAHAIITVKAGELGVRLAVQSTTDLIRQLASKAGDTDIRSSVAVLGDLATMLANAIRDAAVDAKEPFEVSAPTFVQSAMARSGLPADSERLVVEMAPTGQESRFRVALDAYLWADCDQATPERLSA